MFIKSPFNILQVWRIERRLTKAAILSWLIPILHILRTSILNYIIENSHCLINEFAYLHYLQTLLYIPLAILLGNLSDYFFIKSPTTSDTVTAYGCVAGIIICSICVSITNHSGFHMGRVACLVSRISLLNAIYDKVRKK